MNYTRQVKFQRFCVRHYYKRCCRCRCYYYYYYKDDSNDDEMMMIMTEAKTMSFRDCSSSAQELDISLSCTTQILKTLDNDTNSRLGSESKLEIGFV